MNNEDLATCQLGTLPESETEERKTETVENQVIKMTT